jgi:hypothetical protein
MLAARLTHGPHSISCGHASITIDSTGKWLPRYTLSSIGMLVVSRMWTSYVGLEKGPKVVQETMPCLVGWVGIAKNWLGWLKATIANRSDAVEKQ